MSQARGMELADLQTWVRRLLSELDRVAADAGIPYFLAYGTALGAVRDGDLIPWDADADVWVASEHHADLVDACRRLLSPDLELLSAETHRNYEYLFPRLAVRGTHHVLLSLDVFPLDPAPASQNARSRHQKVARLLDRAFLVKCGDTGVRAHYSTRKRLVATALRALLLPVPRRLLLGTFRWLQRRHAGSGSGLLVNSCGAYGAREVFDAQWFEGSAAMLVGDLPLPVPQGYDDLLTGLYGDYRVPVPPERQRQELDHALATFVAPLREPGGLLAGEPR